MDKKGVCVAIYIRKTAQHKLIMRRVGYTKQDASLHSRMNK